MDAPSGRSLLLLLALATSACASRQKHPYPFPNPPRIPDSAREKHDATKNLPPPEGLQADDDRWGIDQAQELKRQNADRKAKARAEGALVPMPSPTPEETSSETGTTTPRYIVK